MYIYKYTQNLHIYYVNKIFILDAINRLTALKYYYSIYMSISKKNVISVISHLLLIEEYSADEESYLTLSNLTYEVVVRNMQFAADADISMVKK